MDITVFFNTKRKWILAIGQLIFIAIGGYLFFYPELLSSVLVRNETIIRTIGAFSLIYFSFIFLLSIKIYFRKVALIVSRKGLIDSSNSLSVGFIPWSSVVDICQIHEGSVAMVKIDITNSELIIDREKNFIKRLLLRRQNKKLGSPIVIPMIALNTYVDTLERQLTEKWEQYKLASES
ncbi:hypothetical protein FAZ19_23650 [Sphingobacterium alkalisoli]|uniref:Uncharacterized protein n=1 Tax=Sphingobacterium alkalisoli TaxID=1874115 RepID=A0A4U0GMY8_9SPHI|nr:STM3941 family protein [Sphingobacterium alkalisoli]TJY59684.1 hypothetical protein FAZ19_23650 [Sphingobacterium alkalisoli]